MPTAFARWRSFSRSRGTRVVTFFGQQLVRNREVAERAAAWKRWRANARAVRIWRTLAVEIGAHLSSRTDPSTLRRALEAWGRSAVLWRAAHEVATRWRSSHRGARRKLKILCGSDEI